MNIEIMVNDYLLAWYLLYGASLSKEIDRFKRSLYTKYTKEYNKSYYSMMIEYIKIIHLNNIYFFSIFIVSYSK